MHSTWENRLGPVQKKIPIGLFGPKKRVRKGDILLYYNSNVEVLNVEVGKYLIVRFLDNTRKHLKVEWDSPLWKRDPHYKENAKAKAREEQKLQNFFDANNLGPAPYRWSYEYQEYKSRRKQLIQEYKEQYAGNARKRKKGKAESSRMFDNRHQCVLPRTSIFDQVKIQELPARTKKISNFGGYLAGDPYNDHRIYHSIEEYNMQNETHEEYVKRLREIAAIPCYSFREFSECDSDEYATDVSYNRKRNAETHGRNIATEQCPIDQFLSEQAEEQHSEDSSSVISGLGEFFDDCVVSDSGESEQDTSNDAGSPVPNDAAETSNVSVSSASVIDPEFDISAFQVPSMYAAEKQDSVASFEWNSPARNTPIISQGSCNFPLSSYQSKLVEASSRVDSDEYSVNTSEPLQSKYSVLYYDNDYVDHDSSELFFHKQYSGPVEQEPDQPQFSCAPREISFDVSSTAQSAYQIHFFDDTSKEQRNSCNSSDDSSAGSFLDQFGASSSDDDEVEGEMAYLFE